jgi:cell division protease FtsH
MVLEKSRHSFLGGMGQTSREYSDKMAENMDEFIKSSLHERYKNVLERLQEYKPAIESIVKLLYKKENITGEEVRDIIIAFEKENNLVTKVNIVVDDIEEELKADAKMAEGDKNIKQNREESDEK